MLASAISFDLGHETWDVSLIFRMSSKGQHNWRGAILGALLVLAGLGTTFISVLARRLNDTALASFAAIASLILVALIIIFVVPPLVRSSRSEVARLDFPFEITAGGAIFICVLAIVAFAAWNTGNNLLFLVLSVLASTLFVAWASARASLRDLVVSARFPDHIFAGEAAPVIVTLRNTKRLLPSFSITIEARGPLVAEAQTSHERKQLARQRFGKRALAYFVYVPHRAAAEQRVEQVFKARGHVPITGFELSTRFPFGFFRRRRRLPARHVDIIVYPKPEPINDELHLLPMNAGRVASMRRGAGHDLLALRDYQPLDDLRYMDWKASARARRLIVREWTSEDERRITVALDTRAIKDEREEDSRARFERGVTLAASLVSHFTAEGAEVRLILGAEGGRYGRSQEHLYDCLKRLALVSPANNSGTDDATPDEQRRSLLKDENLLLPAGDGNYVILLTTAAPGTIHSSLWRTSHVIYL